MNSAPGVRITLLCSACERETEMTVTVDDSRTVPGCPHCRCAHLIAMKSAPVWFAARRPSPEQEET